MIVVQHLNEINQLEVSMQHKKDAMAKARKEYVKAWKEAQAAHAKHMKADHNMDISRAELEKARHNALVKGQASEDAKNNYAHVLQVANQQQTMHYAELLPNVLEVCRLIAHASNAFSETAMCGRGTRAFSGHAHRTRCRRRGANDSHRAQMSAGHATTRACGESRWARGAHTLGLLTFVLQPPTAAWL